MTLILEDVEGFFARTTDYLGRLTLLVEVSPGDVTRHLGQVAGNFWLVSAKDVTCFMQPLSQS